MKIKKALFHSFLMLLLTASLFFIPTESLFAKDSETPLDELVFSKEGVKVNVSLFANRNIEPSWATLAESFPRLLISELKICNTHVFSENELLSIREKLIKDKTISLYRKLEEKHTQRDLLLFDDERTPKKYKDLTKEIDELKKQIDQFERIDPAAIPLPSEYPIILAEEPIKDNESAGKSADLLITGSIEQFEDYFFISVKLWNEITKEETVIYRSTGTPGEFPDLAKAASVQLREVILGRPWAILTVTDVPEDARVSVDGKFWGVGTTTIEVLKPGDHLVEVSAKGMLPYFQQVTLKAYKELSLNISMEMGKIDSILISSYPAGADVYLGSTWMGVTPLNIARPDIAIQVTLTYPGFTPEKFKLEPISEAEITISLTEGVIDKGEIFAIKKDQFYNSMMWFSLSLAIPTITGGIAQNLYNQASATASTGDINRTNELAGGYYASMTVFWCSVALSGGLAINMFYRLYQYIKAGEAVAE